MDRSLGVISGTLGIIVLLFLTWYVGITVSNNTYTTAYTTLMNSLKNFIIPLLVLGFLMGSILLFFKNKTF